MTQSLAGASLADEIPDRPALRRAAAGGHPLVRLYRTRDNRWLSLYLLQDR